MKFNIQKVQNFIKEFSNEQNLSFKEESDISASPKKRKDFLPSYCKICGSAHRNHPDYEEKCKKKKLDPLKSINTNYDEILLNYEPSSSTDDILNHPSIVTKLDSQSINSMLNDIDVQLDSSQQEESSIVLEESLNCFSSSIINDSLKVLGPNENNEKVLVPTHVYTAIMNNFEKYAFLWNVKKK